MLKKLFSYFQKQASQEKNYDCGTDTIVRGTVYKSHPESSVIIGDDCLVEGTLTTYTQGSRITIGNKVFIGYGTLIGAAGSISIGDNVLISFDCLIQDNDTHSLNAQFRENDVIAWKHGKKDWSKINSKPVIIESNAWIGAKCIILKGVRIGKNSIVGAGSVVTKNVEDNTIVAGNPAHVIKHIR